jgi:hypothetical protein
MQKEVGIRCREIVYHNNNVHIIYMIQRCKEDLYNLLWNGLINKNFSTKDKALKACSQRYNLQSAC